MNNSGEKNIIRERFPEKRVILFDGAYGSLLQREEEIAIEARKAGVEKLCLSRPERVRALHTEYLQAGAEILSSNSFNILNPELLKEGLTQEVAARAAALAREAVDAFDVGGVGKESLVAGSIGPSGFGLGSGSSLVVISPDELEQLYYDQMIALLGNGADLMLLETMTGIAVSLCGFRAAERVSRETGIFAPIWVSAALDRKGRLVGTGEQFSDFYDAVVDYGPVAIGLNCVSDFKPAESALLFLRRSHKGLISFHPSAGLPVKGEYIATPESFVEGMRPILEQGIVDIIGGCCGTTPGHIRRLAELIKEI
ncbi:MAG: homocysteine S-methyltransferase family protein [bacterium]|nr:homocysteine S-methyltransferase family protein [bacterium]